MVSQSLKSYSVAKLQAATGYLPPYSLAEAAARIAAWYGEAHQERGR